MDITELREGFAGTRFRDLILHHIAKQKQADREQAIQGTLSVFPETARVAVERFLRDWTGRVHQKAFWNTDTALVFDEVIADARRALSEVDGDFDDDDAFNLFNLVCLSFASAACEEPAVRRTAGILDRGLPWPSLLSLVYPISAALWLYMRSQGTASLLLIAGYGIANLGYLLLAAGLLFGSFRAFALTKRWQVLTAAAIAFVIGTIFANVGAGK